MLPNPEIKPVSIYDYLKIIQKRAKIIVLFLIILPLAATIFVFTSVPVYRATVSIAIERTAPKVTKIEQVYESETMDNTQFYQTQYKILASRSLSERVFDELGLGRDADFRKPKDPIAKLMSMVQIEPVRNSRIVLINIDDIDSLRASSIANAYAKAYIQQDIENRMRATKEAVGWLELQLTDIKKKLQQSEEALNKYIQENKIVAVPDVEKKTESLLESLKQERSRVETDIAQLSKRYKAKHPKMIALNAQLEEVNRKIGQETDNLMSLNRQMVQYNLLKKDAESSQQLYTSILMRAKETDVSEKLEASNIRIVDSARPPDNPISPQKTKTIIISIFLALFGGVAVSFLLEYLDATIRTAEDITLYINLPFLGYVPSIGKEAKTDAQRSLIAFQMPKSAITESYRAIRTAIIFASPEDKPLKTILITSSLPQEGKSFFSLNIATVFAQVNEKIVLVDIDMRRPKVHKSFNFEQRHGISDYLTGGIELDSIIQNSPIPNLSVICAGTIPPNPSELLTSGKINTLFEILKSRFDRVIVDSPPILSVADTSLLANIADGAVLVTKGASTRIDAAVKAKEKLIQAKGKIIGAVINNIEPEKEDRYYYYHYYYAAEEGKKHKA